MRAAAIDVASSSGLVAEAARSIDATVVPVEAREEA